MREKKALGKGLKALIPDIEGAIEPSEEILFCNIEEIAPNPHQPRRDFDPTKIEELALSIKEKGVLQPLLVRKVGEGYELIAGERRLRAAQKAGLKKVPVIVKKAQEKDLLELSLVENLQREDLNVIEEAEAIKRLLEEFHYTQDTLASRLGKSRSSITNTLRLLRLPQKIKDDLKRGIITMGHARAYLGVEQTSLQLKIHQEVIKKGLSVRQTERLVKKEKQPLHKRVSFSKDAAEIEALTEELKRIFGTKVKIIKRGKAGRIIIEFYSTEEMESILDRLRSL